MIVSADLHIHSRFAMASSRAMTPESLLAAAARKGLDVLGSGDALHPAWRADWRDRAADDAGILVVPSAEVEDRHRVHHLILMEDLDLFTALADRLDGQSRNIGSSGRPHVSLPAEEIAAAVHDLGGLIGPAHAFTPWTSVYASFDSIPDCYGAEAIDFLELGLSADTSYGAAIPELFRVPFLSNSDAHSPSPHRLGREFTRFEIKKRTVRHLLDAVQRGAIAMNAGFFPEEGKYNRTACIGCYRQYTRDEAEALRWRCPADGRRIKKGVRDRAQELSGSAPGVRPPYLHTVPLGEIVRQVVGSASPETRACRALYGELLAVLGNEIAILVSCPIPEIREVSPAVADAVAALRSGRVVLHPGGGGRYGSISLCRPGRA
ncbi:MAG: endonuclease Q family protein [Methanomicrobiaceae archaeon]|nr:endonuclease Q family protein [Methanomicrobiaceae archaeon]